MNNGQTPPYTYREVVEMELQRQLTVLMSGHAMRCYEWCEHKPGDDYTKAHVDVDFGDGVVHENCWPNAEKVKGRPMDEVRRIRFSPPNGWNI